VIDELLPRQDCGLVVTTDAEIIVFGGSIEDAFIFNPEKNSGELLLTNVALSAYQGMPAWY
jgi:hypothetical protein